MGSVNEIILFPGLRRSQQDLTGCNRKWVTLCDHKAPRDRSEGEHDGQQTWRIIQLMCSKLF